MMDIMKNWLRYITLKNITNNMTAVEWLEQQLKSTYDNEGKLPLAYTLDLIRQAKEMEKEQIMKANFDGYYERVHGEYKTVERYYKEKYGENKD